MDSTEEDEEVGEEEVGEEEVGEEEVGEEEVVEVSTERRRSSLAVLGYSEERVAGILTGIHEVAALNPVYIPLNPLYPPAPPWPGAAGGLPGGGGLRVAAQGPRQGDPPDGVARQGDPGAHPGPHHPHPPQGTHHPPHPPHPLTTQGTVQLDLQLRDGVRICQLMNKLREASIPHTDITTGSTDSKRSNIQLFLEAAQEYGLPQQYLFEVRGW